jgi:hypothetical protein
MPVGWHLPGAMQQGGSAAPLRAVGCSEPEARAMLKLLGFADIILTSSSPRDESVRRRTRDCSIHHNKFRSPLVGSEDELSRAPLQLTCAVDDPH